MEVTVMQIYVTEFDMKRLRDLIDLARRSESYSKDYLNKLSDELDRGQLVVPEDVPKDVVTMNSRVCLKDMDTGEETIYTLVFPEDADISQGKISVLAPIGTAMFGYRLGDTFTWEIPDGVTRLQVKEILYQPEASGDYHL
jgi:regulator of nucleoside diphosphate kinase